MRITYTVTSLDTADAWDDLAPALGDGHPFAVQSTIRHLRILGAKSYVLEKPYIDRDYSADYLHFYARTFRAHARHCKRAHFFCEDLSPLLRQSRSTEQLRQLREFARTSYCGFCVIRPLSTAPIGRTVLRAEVRSRQGMEATVTCRAPFHANLLGVDLEVTGAAYLQQDARVGACAQVAIWAGMRHMHARYRYNWVSVADITRLATPTAPDEATSLPAGSDFLATERMLRAISDAGYQPLCFRRPDIPFRRPEIAAAILPYVESGIPVILGLDIGAGVGHAVTVVGRVFATQAQPTNTAIDYVPALIVHDDQGGPYMSLPVADALTTPHSFGEDTIKRATSSGTVELSASHANFAVALMSPRVFSTAVAAEVTARDRLDDTLARMPHIRRLLRQRQLPVNDRLLDELLAAQDAEHIVLRTYLTSAAGYRRHIADGTASDELKDALLELHLPHFTWITEILTIDSYNNHSAGMRRMYGHTIIDATSTGRDGDGLLMLHLPGLVFTKGVNAPPDAQESEIGWMIARAVSMSPPCTPRWTPSDAPGGSPGRTLPPNRASAPPR